MSDGRDDDLYADRAYRPGPPPELREPPRRRSRALGVFVATFALAAFAGVVWYAYDQGLRRGTETTAPLIKADPRPTKVRPEQPGGLQVPNQDKLVYEAMRPGDNSGAPRIERLLPPPERPVEPPAPPPLPTISEPAPVAEAPIPPAQTPAAPAPSDSGIPPARIVMPAPAPLIPRPEDTAPPAAPAPRAEVAPPPPPAPAPVDATPAPPPATSAPAPVASSPPVESTPPVAPAAPAQEPKPTATAAAPVALAAGNFRIQLGALRDEAAAEAEWARLKKRHADQLGSLDRRIQRVDLGPGKGVFYRIQSSGVSEASAEAICAGLKAKAQPCLVVRP